VKKRTSQPMTPPEGGRGHKKARHANSGEGLPKRGLRCALYARISPTNEKATESGGYSNYSISSQLHEMTQFAEAQGWYTDQTLHFIDDRVTGAVLERPALDRIRELVRCREVDVFLVFSTDRLTREMLHLLLLQDECDRHQVQLRFVRENYDPTPEGQMLMQLRGAFNQFERLKIKERTTRGRRQKARDGFVHSVGKRFGYTYLGKAQGSKGELRIDPAEAKIVRRIFDEYLRGKRLGQIRVGLNRDGVKSARGGLWSRPVIHHILTNAMYTGQMRGPGGIPVRCPAIIGEEIFARTQSQMMHSKAANVGRPTRQYLLTGRMWCKLCGRRHCTYPRTRPEPNYRCGNIDYTTYKRRCPALGVRQSRIEAAVWEETWGAITDPETLYGLIEAYRASFADNADDAQRAAVLKRLRLRQQRAVQMLCDPEQPYDEAKRRKMELDAEIAAIEQEAKRAEVFQMPAKRAVEALAREIAAEEPESFEDRRGVLERLQILVRYDSRTREAEIEGRFNLPGMKNCRNGVNADSERQGCDGDGRKRWIALHLAQAVAHVLQESFHAGPTPRFANVFLHHDAVAEGPLCPCPPDSSASSAR
jgi:site-specific DNA recombinase